MKTLIAVAALTALITAPAMAGEKKTFADLDGDANGTLSLAEVQAAAPDVTAEKFARYDADASGELSEAEYNAWKAAKAAKPSKSPEGAPPKPAQ
jgi:hypothetical protein